MRTKDDTFKERAALIKIIQMLGIDPMSMGSMCYQIVASDLLRRFRSIGYHRTMKQVIASRPHLKSSGQYKGHELNPD